MTDNRKVIALVVGLTLHISPAFAERERSRATHESESLSKRVERFGDQERQKEKEQIQEAKTKRQLREEEKAKDEQRPEVGDKKQP